MVGGKVCVIISSITAPGLSVAVSQTGPCPWGGQCSEKWGSHRVQRELKMRLGLNSLLGFAHLA